MDPKLTQYVIESFSTDNSLKKYTNDVHFGLWTSEKILIEKYFKQCTTVLDLGCGAGRTTFAMAKMDYTVTGVDVTPKHIKIAKDLSQKNNTPVKFEVGDATHLDFLDNSFDNVLFSFNGWSMIPSKLGRFEAVKEIHRVLKKGGWYIFTVHKRQFFGQELTWLMQLIRLYLLKPLGYKTKEQDFGDFYFKKDSETTYPIEQFVSIMNIHKVKQLLESVGFKVVLMKMRNEIAPQDSNLTSGNVMFFVCQKI